MTYFKMHSFSSVVLFLCSISSCFYFELATCNEDLDVIIIGAGASGIAAATRLLQNNFSNFLVLEGSDRIGGRINTVQFGGNTIDLGGEWVHGKTNNPAFELAAPLGLLYTRSNYSGEEAFIKSCGMPVNDNLVRVSEELFGILTSPNNEIKNWNDAQDKSLGDVLLKLYWSRVDPLIANGKVTRKEADEFLFYFEKATNTMDGSPSWLQTSLFGDYEFVDNVEDFMLVWKGGHGYSTILDLLTQKLPNPSKKLPIDEKILLNKEVIKVDWSAQKVIVTTADGSQFTTKRVISTVSLAVLKEIAASLFLPSLPSSKLSAIQGLGISVIDKIYLEFPYHWLPSGINGINMIWHAKDKALVPAKYNWSTEVIGFYQTDRSPLTVLCGWIGGDAAEAMEAATDEEVIEQSMMLLRKFSPNKTEVPNPIAMRRSQWRSNRFIRGSYSFRHIDSDALNIRPADLSSPVNNSEGKPVILFAGEATEGAHYGSVHGAIKAGWREADRILSSQ